MIKFSPTILDDQSTVLRWMTADPYHSSQATITGPGWWLTGQGLLSGCIEDAHGPAMFFRFDREDNLVRLHTQFGPENEVSKRRVVKVIMEALPALRTKALEYGSRGFIFESTSPLLIRFMYSIGFGPADKDNVNDHVWIF